MNSMALLLMALLFGLALFGISVLLIRWALRINDIVQRLDKIVELLNAK